MQNNSSFNKHNPERRKRVNESSYLCQCYNGHLFDYRDRVKYEGIYKQWYAPCQGKCPVCGTGEFSFIGTGINVYPIKLYPN